MSLEKISKIHLYRLPLSIFVRFTDESILYFINVFFYHISSDSVNLQSLLDYKIKRNR